MLKILLIDTGYSNYELNEPLGIEVIKEYLVRYFEKMVSIDVVATLLESEEKYLNNEYEIVCISANFNDNGMFNKVITYFYHLEKKPLIVVGGVYPTIFFEGILNEFNEVICVIGEGENALVGIIEQKLYGRNRYCDLFRDIVLDERITNIAIKIDGKIIMHRRESVELAQINFYPQRKYAQQLIKKKGLFRIEGSRGCDWNECSFCILKWKYCFSKRRCYPVSKLLNEIEYLCCLGAEAAYFTDEDFIGNDFLRLREFIAGIKEMKREKRIKEKFSFFVSSSTRYLLELFDSDTSMLSDLGNIGCQGFFLGIESGSQSQLNRYNKGVTVEENIKILKILTEYGFEVDVGYIMFDPFVTIEELRENLDFINHTCLVEGASRYLKRLRLIPHTKYCEECLSFAGEYSFSKCMLEYTYSFVNPGVQEMYEKVNKYEHNHISIEYFLQKEKRNNIIDSNNDNDDNVRMLKSLRKKDLDFFTSLLTEKK